MFRKISKFSPNRFVVGFIVGAMLFSGSAFAYNSYVSENTPDTGYLLCANSKTKAVTFPNKLSCPAGTVALDLGAVRGLQGDDGKDGAIGANGAQGPMGLTGPMGTQGIRGNDGVSTGSEVYWGVSTSPIDIVADGTINTSTDMVKKIMYTLKTTGVPSGYYRLEGHISGLWSSSATTSSLIQCGFQTQTNYDKKVENYKWGKASKEKGSWNGLSLNVLGDWSTSEGQIYFVCSTSGTVKDINVEVDVTSATLAGKLP